MKYHDRGVLDGLLMATAAVAEITGKLPFAGMSDETWWVICAINKRLVEMAAAAAAASESERGR